MLSYPITLKLGVWKDDLDHIVKLWLIDSYMEAFNIGIEIVMLFSGVWHRLSQAQVVCEKVERGDKYRRTEERG